MFVLIGFSGTSGAEEAVCKGGLGAADVVGQMHLVLVFLGMQV